jgi:hypothetical protein
MGTCGCKWCPKKVESPVKFIATIGAAQGTDVAPDAIEIHTRKCVTDSAKNKVLLAFDEYLKLEPGDWNLIEELKAKIISAS